MRIRLTAAAALWAACGASGAAQPRIADPFAGDKRLAAPRTVEAAGLTVAEMLAELSRHTGVAFTADARVAQDKVVLYAHERPLGETLRALAGFFRFTWSAEGPASARTYRLMQGVAQRRAEEAEIDARYYEAADRILAEIALIRSAAGKSAEEIKAAAQDAQQRLQTETDPAKRAELLDVSMVLGRVAEPGATSIAAQALAGLNRDALVRLMKGGRTDFVWPPQPGKPALPVGARDAIWEAVRAQNARSSSPVTGYDTARLTITAAPGVRPGLHGMAMAGAQTGSGVSSSGSGFLLPILAPDLHPAAEEAVAPADWQQVPALQPSASLHVPRTAAPDAATRLPLPFLARAVAELERAEPIDLIADAFYGTRSTDLSLDGHPVGTILTYLAQATNHRWRYADGFVLLQSNRYAVDRAAEPRVSDLRRWAAMPPSHLLTLDTLAEIADQPYAQYENTVAVLADVGAMARTGTMGGPRSHLVFWHRLSPLQRKAALSPAGLPYQALSPALRRAFELASMDLLAPDMTESSNQELPWDPRALANARLLVTVEEHLMWGVRRQGGYSAVGGEKEQALKSLQRANPGLKEEDLREARSAVVRFAYRGPDGPGHVGALMLPLVWLEGDAQ